MLKKNFIKFNQKGEMKNLGNIEVVYDFQCWVVVSNQYKKTLELENKCGTA